MLQLNSNSSNVIAEEKQTLQPRNSASGKSTPEILWHIYTIQGDSYKNVLVILFITTQIEISKCLSSISSAVFIFWNTIYQLNEQKALCIYNVKGEKVAKYDQYNTIYIKI